ncbi:MAG TPA: hypothetical protein IAD01_01735 [Candidatus Faeciplasma gallinarum]|uniref:Uncharacterized protein n=1 Tax=Candidatus Faeciplasma gallinarum TaxID=2840799 RepID=A0A9D1EMN5_9FIRM|nr:hypothetical protein [Candidatus Faeciplasma gallinarum]
MQDMLKRYLKEADMLLERSRALGEELARETDVDKSNLLAARKRLLDIERYEILLDIRSIREYLE